MEMEYESMKPETLGVINGFFAMSPEAQQSICASLHISLSPAVIARAALCYKAQNAQPTAWQLCFLSAFLRSVKQSPDSFGIMSVSGSPTVIDTFARMRNAYAFLHPNDPRPLSLRDAASLAADTIAALQKRPPFGADAVFCAQPEPKLLAATHGYTAESTYIATADAIPFCAYRRVRKNRRAASGNLIVLLLPDNSLSAEAFSDRIERILLSESARTAVYDSRAIDQAGICGALLSMLSAQNGVRINTDRLPDGADIDSDITKLCGAYQGGVTVVSDSLALPSLLIECQNCGVNCFAFAYVTSDATLSVTNDRAFPLLTLPITFLRELADLRIGHTVTFPDRPQAELVGSLYRLHTPAPAMALTVCATSDCDPYRSGFYATAGILLATVAMGGNPSALTLAAAATLPTTEEESCALFGLLLGFFHVQSALGIASAQTDLSHVSSTKTPALSLICTVAQNQSILSSTAVGQGVISCLAPDQTADGMPNLNSLIALLKHIAQMHEQGQLLSARVVLDTSPLDTLTQMIQEHTYTVEPSLQSIAAHRIPLGILVETAQPIGSTPLAYPASATSPKTENSSDLKN